MRRLIALSCALPLVLAACGSSSNSSSSSTKKSSSSGGSAYAPPPASTPAPTTAAASGGSGSTLDITAEEPGPEKFGFSKTKLSAKAGNVTIALKLPNGLKAPHGIAIEGNGVDKDGAVVQAGSSTKVTADLKPGTYTYYCPVSDHREEGMEGKLVVK